MQHRITVESSDSAFPCRSGQSVLEAMSGSSARGIDIGCRSGGCGVCRVQVLSGQFDSGVMSAEEVTADCREQGIVLACRIFPSSDLHLRVLGKRMQRCAQLSTADLIRSLSKGASKESNRSGLSLIGALA